MRDGPADLSIRRSFNWGALFVGDAEAEFETETDLRDHGGVKASRFHAWIPVRHAQDVELTGDVPKDEPIPPFEVTVTCQVLPAANVGTLVEIVLEVPSGRISLGDPDGTLDFAVTSGQWLLQVVVDPPDHAEHVDLQLSPILPGIDEP